MATYTWSIPTGQTISGNTYIKDTDDKLQNTLSDLVDFVNGEGSHLGQGLTYDLVDKATAQTVTGVKTFSNGIVSNVTGDVTGDLTGNAATASEATALGTGADRTKLDGIEAGATADQTGAEIKLAYEAEADTNAYTDAEKTKLQGVEDGANNYTYTLPAATALSLGGVKASISGTTLTLEF